MLDLILGIALGIILFPFCLFIYILIKIDSQGPGLHIQNRIGQHKSIFRMYKFRTMTDEKHALDLVLWGDKRLTNIGKYLRRYHLDELPQIYNIILGHMSFVGPRPMMEVHLSRLTEESEPRFKVKPGITGLAQITGGVNMHWEQRWPFDRQYVADLSFIKDLSILAQTFGYILNRT